MIEINPVPRLAFHGVRIKYWQAHNNKGVIQTFNFLQGGKMNKAELIEKVAEITNGTKADAGRAIDAVFDAVTDALKNNEKVAISGFGTFSVTARSARKGRNPQTGEEIEIKAANVPKFSAAKKLKEELN
jgi:DNA-binding protein HU-beta